MAWKVTGLGGGDSAPAIAAGRVFGMGTRGDDELVWALSEKDGKELWMARLGPAVQQGMPQSREGPGCTPTVDGDRLYVLGMGGSLACLQVADGKVVWELNLVTDFGGIVPTWSYRESPLIDGDKRICTPGGDDALLVALDNRTGKIVWKSRMPGAPADAAPAPGSPAAASGRGGGGGPGGPEGAGAPMGASIPGAGSPGAVSGTRDPGLFQSERFVMRAFSSKLPNGPYLAKLYFAETYEGITGPGQRVFLFNVQGKEFKDFDIWQKAGGPRRAYLETVPVVVTNGEFRILFTPQVENPAIKAIEVITQSVAEGAVASAPTLRVKAGVSEPFTDSSGQVWHPDSGFEGQRQYLQLTADALLGVAAQRSPSLVKTTVSRRGPAQSESTTQNRLAPVEAAHPKPLPPRMSKARASSEVRVQKASCGMSADSHRSSDAPSAAQQRFLSLFLRSEREIFRYVAALVPNVTDAEDIVQQTAIALWEKFDAYDPTRPFTPWACRFALNKARQWIERRQRWQALLDQGLAEELALRRQALQPEFERRFRHLEDCLGKLPSAQRALVQAFYYERVDVESLAARSGRTVAATYKMLQRIRHALQRCVEDQSEPELA
ncbi:MAG: sigma-70 family RNA polymerase sigma factor [Verrucomicrobia bacterium]|nr:sigma-70 family RNA polymerase sigma factor [Verrucomicrobiota bacterium]